MDLINLNNAPNRTEKQQRMAAFLGDGFDITCPITGNRVGTMDISSYLLATIPHGLMTPTCQTIVTDIEEEDDKSTLVRLWREDVAAVATSLEEVERTIEQLCDYHERVP